MEQDNYKEHSQHTTEYDLHCSECFKKASQCKECKGYGTLSTDYVNADHNIERGAGDDVTCENCNGSGLEPDEDIIKERLANA